jgi:DNA-binding NtrC family response regulator
VPDPWLRGIFISMRNTSSKILLVDDDDDLRELLTEHFIKHSYTVLSAQTVGEAMEILEEKNEEISVIVSDMRLPGVDGLAFLDQVNKRQWNIPFIVVTASRSVEPAIQAIRQGAYDYLLKPIDFHQLDLLIERAFKLREIQSENQNLKKVLTPSEGLDGAIGRSAPMKRVFDLVQRVAPTDASVLITGESGVGKEVIAQLIHRLSSRASGNFVAVNCAAIPETLLESELFGHAKGAYTGAAVKKEGLFETAHHGTLFLDEIGDMSPVLQAKLLRTLQERKIRRLGETRDIDVDVRIVAATHKNLHDEVKERRFREDLFFRLNVIPIHIAPLRERRDDIILLTEHFLRKLSLRYGLTKTKHVSRDALHFLLKQIWKGNVRELENTLERAFVLSRNDEEIGIDDFLMGSEAQLLAPQDSDYLTVPESSFYTANSLPPASDMGVAQVNAADSFLKQVKQTNALMSLEDMANKYVDFVVRHCGGIKEKAAKVLEIDRKTLSRRLKDGHKEGEGAEGSAALA